MRYLITGGAGKLGQELQKVLHCVAPSHAVMDITKQASVVSVLDAHKPDVVIHCAAYTSPPRCETHPDISLATNIGGTLNVATACMDRGIRMVFISTEYVFDGTKGMYSEDDAVFPTNLYAWSKLAGEAIVRHTPNWLIVRCAFTDENFPHAMAPTDQFSSRVTTPEIVDRLLPLLPDARGVFHIGGKRQSVYDYALSLGASPMKGSYKEFPTAVPPDASLDTHKYDTYIRRM